MLLKTKYGLAVDSPWGSELVSPSDKRGLIPVITVHTAMPGVARLKKECGKTNDLKRSA